MISVAIERQNQTILDGGSGLEVQLAWGIELPPTVAWSLGLNNISESDSYRKNKLHAFTPMIICFI